MGSEMCIRDRCIDKTHLNKCEAHNGSQYFIKHLSITLPRLKDIFKAMTSALYGCKFNDTDDDNEFI